MIKFIIIDGAYLIDALNCFDSGRKVFSFLNGSFKIEVTIDDLRKLDIRAIPYMVN